MKKNEEEEDSKKLLSPAAAGDACRTTNRTWSASRGAEARSGGGSNRSSSIDEVFFPVERVKKPFFHSSSIATSAFSLSVVEIERRMSKKAYLLLYNSAQLACWSWALAATVISLKKGPEAVYESAAPAVRTFRENDMILIGSI